MTNPFRSLVPLLLLAIAACTSSAGRQHAGWAQRDAAPASSSRATLRATLAAAPSPPPVIRITNYGDSAFVGWHRVNVDAPPPFAAGRVGRTRFVVGRQTGRDQWAVDLHLELAAAQSLSIDLAAAVEEPFVLGLPPTDPAAHFGGALTFAGVPMDFVRLQPDGASWLAQLRARAGRMLVADVWLSWYPDQPAWCHGEAMIACSNPAVPDLLETIAVDARFAFGDALVVMPDGGSGRINRPAIAAGDVFADGQARVVPLVFLWLRHLQGIADLSSVAADGRLAVCGHGVRQLWFGGNPAFPASFNAFAWMAANVQQALARLYTWDPPVCGPAMVSGVTGAQEDQTFPRGEALRPGGIGAELVTWASAAKMGERPCNHREADGTILDPARHVSPRLVLWDERPHWHTGVSPDRLGKVGSLQAPGLLSPTDPGDTHGRWGADVEHWLMFTLTAGCRYTGSPALQQLLVHQAIDYRLQWTITPGWSTTQPYAARAIGWEAAMAVNFDRQLEDVALRDTTTNWWRARWSTVIRPALDAAPGDRWDIRVDDPRLGPGQWWIPWQQSVGVYWLDVAGEALGVPDARAIALRGALRVVSDSWRQDAAGAWVSSANCPVVGSETAPADGSFNYFGMSLSVAAVLRHDPQNARARAIWTWLLAHASSVGDYRWLAPELVGVGAP